MVGGVWGGVCMAWACMVGDVHSREEPAWRGLRGVCVAGSVYGKGGMHGRRNGHCSGRYASYWNAFLFTF